MKSTSECSPCSGGHFCLEGDQTEPYKEGTYFQFVVRSGTLQYDQTNRDDFSSSTFPEIGGIREPGFSCPAGVEVDAIQVSCPAGVYSKKKV